MSFFDPLAAFEAHLDGDFVPDEVLDEMAATPDHFYMQDGRWDEGFDLDDTTGETTAMLDRVERRRFS